VRTLERDTVVEGGERQGRAVDSQHDLGIADQVLHLPAILGAPPDLDVAVFARNQEDLLDGKA